MIRFLLAGLLAAFGLLGPVSMAGAPTAAAATIGPLPKCSVADVSTARSSLASYATTLLDTYYKLPAAYAPALTRVSAAGFSSANGGGLPMRNLVALTTDLRALRLAAAKASAPLAITSAYRSYSNQVSTFAYWVSQGGYAAALLSSARAGHSEHQLGTAFDFRSAGGTDPWNLSDWATTAAGAWMKTNAWKYGFVNSYPAGMTSVTCYQYEPWHYRYVGRTEAAAIHASGLVPRAWIWSQYGK